MDTSLYEGFNTILIYKSAQSLQIPRCTHNALFQSSLPNKSPNKFCHCMQFTSLLALFELYVGRYCIVLNSEKKNDSWAAFALYVKKLWPEKTQQEQFNKVYYVCILKAHTLAQVMKSIAVLLDNLFSDVSSLVRLQVQTVYHHQSEV